MEQFAYIFNCVSIIVICFSCCECTCTDIKDCIEDAISGRYNNSIIKSKFGQGYSDCFKECMQHSAICMSFNYNKFTGFCELNSDVPAVGDIYPEDGFIHSLIPASPVANDPCNPTPCGASEVCLVLSSGSTTCVKECGSTIPPYSIQAVSTDLYYEVGQQAEFSCTGGQTHIRTCLASGLWSQNSVCGEECDFEAPCSMMLSDNTGDIPFELLTGSTPSGGTGCDFDHTTGSGYYYYMDASEADDGDQARLITTQPISADRQVCLGFWYHMYGDIEEMGSLHVRTKDASNGYTDSFQVASGTQGNAWLQKNQTILAQPSDFWVIIEARRGDGSRSDICIDDVSIHGC